MKKTHDHGLAILVVDDDPEELTTTCDALRSQHEVLSASSGQDALRIARKTRLGAIVLDVMMTGGLDGFSTFNALQHDPNTQRIPVIFLTSVNQATGLSFGAGSLRRYLGTEPAAFLEKPISAAKLCAEVDRILNDGYRT